MEANDVADAEIRALVAASQQELWTARLLVGVASVLSLVASLTMIALFVRFVESRRCGRRILVCLHLSDVGAAIAWLLTLWLPMETTRTDRLCRTQGYLLVFFSLASYIWTACFAFHLYQILGRRSKYPELYENRYHLVAWGIPLMTVFQLGVQQLGGYALVGQGGRPWCWFRSWSHFEWTETGFHVQLFMFYVPVALVFVHNLATYIVLLYRLNDIISTKVEDRIWRRMMAYSWVFFLSFVWGAFAFLYQAFSRDHSLSRIMLYLMSFFTPLQGAMNAVAYGYNSKVKTRVQETAAGFIKR